MSTLHTKDLLADALRQAGLEQMAVKAATGYYHDYISPLAAPCLQLAADLAEAGTPAALALRARHLNGEFDATAEEGDDWMASSDGRATLGALTGRPDR